MITLIIKKNQIAFYFAEEGPGRGSEDIKTGCDVDSFDFFFVSLWTSWVGKITINFKRTELKQKMEKYEQTGKQPEAHFVEKGRLSCDSDAPQVGSGRSDWTSVVNVNRRKADRRKTRPYCI